MARYTVVPKSKLRLHYRIGYLLAVVIAVHIGTILVSHFGGMDQTAVWQLGYGTLARNSGVATAWLLAVVLVTSALKKKIARKWWKRAHMLTGPVLVLGTVHGLKAGPDQSALWVLLPGMVVLTFMASVVLTRIYKSYTKVRGTYKTPIRTLRVMTKPHGLHYRGRKVETIRVPRKREP